MGRCGVESEFQVGDAVKITGVIDTFYLGRTGVVTEVTRKPFPIRVRVNFDDPAFVSTFPQFDRETDFLEKHLTKI